MSTFPQIYRSSDTAAPALTGQPGSLIEVLDAVLVHGYGHGAHERAPAGWTKEFSGVGVAVYRNSPITASGTYLRVDDSASASGSTARIALLRAYEIASSVDEGARPAPTISQNAYGEVFLKSSALNDVSRPWLVVASERFFYYLVDVGNGLAGWVGEPSWLGFAGDIVSRKPGDDFNFYLHGSALQRNWSGSSTDNTTLFGSNRAWSQGGTGGYLLRPYTGASLATTAGPIIGVPTGINIFGGTGDFPDPVSGGLAFDRIYISESAFTIRGSLPNVYFPFHRMPFASGEIKDDIPALPGVEILPVSISRGVPMNSPGSQQGQLLFDVTTDWG